MHAYASSNVFNLSTMMAKVEVLTGYQCCLPHFSLLCLKCCTISDAVHQSFSRIFHVFFVLSRLCCVFWFPKLFHKISNTEPNSQTCTTFHTTAIMMQPVIQWCNKRFIARPKQICSSAINPLHFFLLPNLSRWICILTFGTMDIVTSLSTNGMLGFDGQGQSFEGSRTEIL